MRITFGDLLDVEHGIIVHQVNCKRKMGSGIAAAIKKKWPVVYDEYMSATPQLGSIQLIRVDKNLFVCNLFGQDDYGYVNRHQPYSDKPYTDYVAVGQALNTIPKKGVLYEPYDIYFPYKIGCGLGGGDWWIYSKLIEQYVPNAIIVVKQ